MLNSKAQSQTENTQKQLIKNKVAEWYLNKRKKTKNNKITEKKGDKRVSGRKPWPQVPTNPKESQQRKTLRNHQENLNKAPKQQKLDRKNTETPNTLSIYLSIYLSIFFIYCIFKKKKTSTVLPGLAFQEMLDLLLHWVGPETDYD